MAADETCDEDAYWEERLQVREEQEAIAREYAGGCLPCHARPEHRTCSDCDACAVVVDCGHHVQPAEIAASAHSPYDWTCARCERRRDRRVTR